MAGQADGESAGWDHVETWLFDLDNTLYHPSAGLLDQVNVLMTAFIADRLGLGAEAASRLRQDYWRRYGATMTGLVAEHGIDADEFLHACHRLDLGAIAPDPDLADAIATLPGRRVIHTNGPRHHAERVLDALGLAGHFERIIALEDTGYVPKPAETAHRLAIDLAALAPERTAMVDDMAHNLHHPSAMGMTTIWVRHDPDQPRPGHVHHEVVDLAAFLRDVTADPAPG